MRLRRQRRGGPSWGTCIWYAVLLSSCGPIDQESVRTVAALEIVPANNGDRHALVTLLRRHAATAGLHVDQVSSRWQKFEKQSALPPAYRSSFNVGVWRGANDDEAEVLADDRTHIGRIWLTFPRGTDPARSTRFREPLIADLRRHWPTSRFVPILPSGGLPLTEDLMIENGRYRLKPSAVERYKFTHE